jgi:hypothetical protein
VRNHEGWIGSGKVSMLLEVQGFSSRELITTIFICVECKLGHIV